MIEAWAYIDEGGRVLADSTFTDADQAWHAALGWPTDGEVEAAKARGARVVRVRIIEAEKSDDYEIGFNDAMEFYRVPNLQPVIDWLEKGCDPKEAAKELRIYQARRNAE